MPLASPPQDQAPPRAQEALRGPVRCLALLGLASAQREPPPDASQAHVALVHVPPANVLAAHQKLGPRVSPERRLLHAAQAALERLLPPLLWQRARQRLPQSVPALRS